LIKSNGKNSKNNNRNVEGKPQGSYELNGKISKYGVSMNINVTGTGVSGSYYYTSKGPDNKLLLNGTIDSNNKMKLSELDEKGQETGSFDGVFNGQTYLGRFQTPQGKSMTFDLKLAE